MPQPVSLSVVTLNTWKCDGDYRSRLRAMAAEARRLSPDILMLQEAFAAPASEGTGDADTAAHLALAMNCGFAGAPARDKEREFEGKSVRSISGLAVIGRGEIATSRSVPLPAPPEDDERISQIVEMTVDGKRLLAVNTHLTHVADADDARQEEIEKTLAALPPLDDFDAALLAGDFNCPPDSGPIRWLLNEAAIKAIDVCAEAGADMITRDTSSHHPPRQIDFIFLLETGKGTPVAIDGVRRVFDTPDPASRVLPSDHYGVMAEITVG